MKYCKDCQHYTRSNIGMHGDICTNPAYAKPIDIVRGERPMAYCGLERNNKEPGHCGPDAAGFEIHWQQAIA